LKKISSKVIKTVPFIERRIRKNPSINKYRRIGDILPGNIVENHAINSAIYRALSGKLRASNHNSPHGKFFDCYV